MLYLKRNSGVGKQKAQTRYTEMTCVLRGCRSGHVQHEQTLSRTVIKNSAGDEYLQIGFDRKEPTEVVSRQSSRNRKRVREIATLLLQTNAPEPPEAQTIPASLDKRTNYSGTALAASCQSAKALENKTVAPLLQSPLRGAGEAIKAPSTSLFNELQLLPSAVIRREHPTHSCNNSPGWTAPLTAATAASLLAATGTAEFLLPATKALWQPAASYWQAPHHQHLSTLQLFPLLPMTLRV